MSHSSLKRYFERFSDKFHRMELAFIILKEATIMTNANVVCQFLWHPDSWYVLETEHYTKVLFAGHLLTLLALWLTGTATKRTWDSLTGTSSMK